MTMTEQQYRDQKASYTDAEGLISQDKNPGRWTSGNGALDTALDRVILFLNGWLKPRDCTEFERTISNLWHEGRPGLLSRNKGRGDQDSWDNYLGACVGAFFCDTPEVARAIRAYGESHCWIFQNESGFTNLIKGTLFRFPGMTAIVKIAANDAHPPSNIELAGLGYRLSDPPDHPGEAKAKLLMALCVLHNYPAVSSYRSLRDAAFFQIRCIRSKWGSLEAMIAAYYDDNPTDGIDRNPFAGVQIPLPYWFTKDSSCPV